MQSRGQSDHVAQIGPDLRSRCLDGIAAREGNRQSDQKRYCIDISIVVCIVEPLREILCPPRKCCSGPSVAQLWAAWATVPC